MKEEPRTVPMAEWGKDHWSMLGYVECVCVDLKGVVDRARVRCNPKRHPGLALSQHSQKPDEPYKYASRLTNGTEPEHDDWDCFYDLEAEGLIRDVGTGIAPRAVMTPRGSAIAHQLREHKAKGGMFATFKPDLTNVPAKVEDKSTTLGEAVARIMT